MREASEERDFNPNCSALSVLLPPEGREQLLLPADTCSCVFVVSPSSSSSSAPRQLQRRDDSATDVLSNKPDKWTVRLWHKVNSQTPRVHKTIQPLLFFSTGGRWGGFVFTTAHVHLQAEATRRCVSPSLESFWNIYKRTKEKGKLADFEIQTIAAFASLCK